MFAVHRHLFRRPLRTSLTVAGVAIGILALTVLGAMAERVGQLAAGSRAMWAQSITLLPRREGPLSELILPAHVERVRAVAGVARVLLRLEFPYAGAAAALPGLVPMVSGVEPEHLASLPLQEGRIFTQSERGVAVAGAAIAAREKWRIGDWVEVQGRAVRLVGIAAPFYNVTDDWLYLPLADARETLVASSSLLQSVVRAQGVGAEGGSGLHVNQLATRLQVLWHDGVDPEELAQRLQREVPVLTVLSPQMVDELVQERLRLVRAVVLGGGLIGLIVSAVSVVNTMLMSVTERRPAIALKRALGATTAAILREVVAESVLLCGLGGLVGAVGGSIVASIVNVTGDRLFLITPRLIGTGLVISVLLGALAGLAPAWHAAKLSPVEGLRRE